MEDHVVQRLRGVVLSGAPYEKSKQGAQLGYEVCLAVGQCYVTGCLEDVLHFGEDIFEIVQTVIGNRAYNACRILELSNSKHSTLSLQDMSQFLKALVVVMDVKSHGHLCCSVMSI